MSFASRHKRDVILAATCVAVGIVVGVFMYAYTPSWLRTGDSSPPVNFVKVSPRIDTAGQPSAAQLRALRRKGYDLVINLAPPDSFGSIPDEGALVAETGIVYVNIPVDFKAPSIGAFDFFSNVLKTSAARHVLVHCQLNGRASVFVFLYRVVHDHADPDAAYEKVTAAWVPNDRWKAFADRVLRQHHIDYELY
ncbi:MAG: protein tyrosine phosphatase family protein [Calditrichia bacterium]